VVVLSGLIVVSENICNLTLSGDELFGRPTLSSSECCLYSPLCETTPYYGRACQSPLSVRVSRSQKLQMTA